MKTKLTPVSGIPAYALIIRGQWERGEAQRDAIKELTRRGGWMSDEQIQAGGLTKEAYRELQRESIRERGGVPQF